MPSLEDDPRQTLTIAGLEKGQGTISATTLTSSGPASLVVLCANWRTLPGVPVIFLEDVSR